MKRTGRRSVRLTALALALALLALLPPARSGAADGVYFTAVNDNLLELRADTMPFASGGTLYIPQTVFSGAGLEVRYVRNNAMGLAVLYTNREDLRFDLTGHTVSDRDGNDYVGAAVERNGYVFFPIGLVCRFFGLTWSYTSTDTAPLVRITDGSAALSDVEFADAASASGLMAARYEEYEASLAQNESASGPPIPAAEEPPTVQAAEGQRVCLIVSGGTDSLRDAADVFGSGAQAVFLLTEEQLADGDLLRGLVSRGHSVALLSSGGTEEELEAELSRARDLAWQGACLWLDLAWYEGSADAGTILREEGFAPVTAGLDWRGSVLNSSARAERLIRAVGESREDAAVCLGESWTREGLLALTDGLLEADFILSGWRSGA